MNKKGITFIGGAALAIGIVGFALSKEQFIKPSTFQFKINKEQSLNQELKYIDGNLCRVTYNELVYKYQPDGSCVFYAPKEYCTDGQKVYRYEKLSFKDSKTK